MAPILLQHVQRGTSSAGTTLTVANVATQPNSLLVLHIGCRAATQNSISSVSGGWTRRYTQNSIGNFGNVWVGDVLGATAQPANGFLITAAVSGSIEYEFWEWSGINVTSGAYYANNVATGNSVSPTVSSSASVSAGDIALSSIFWPNGNDSIGTLATGWTTDPTIQGTATGQSSSLRPGWISPGSSGTQTFSGTISPSAANWVAVLTAYSAAGGASSGTAAANTAETFTATVSGGGAGASGNPWLHGAVLRGASFPAGYQSSYGGLDVNQGADGAVEWSAVQNALHGPILNTSGAPNYTGSNSIDGDIRLARTYNTSNGVNCTLPWSLTNKWQGVNLRMMSGIHSATYAYCLGAAASGTTNLRGTYSPSATYNIDDGVLFTITVTFPTGGTPPTGTWTGQAGFVCLQNGVSGQAPPTTPTSGSPATNTASASNAFWKQVSFFMGDPNTTTAVGQCPRFWTAEVGAAWFDFESKLAAIYDAAPELIQVEAGLFMTIYLERCLRQITSPGGYCAANMLAAGYVTGALDGTGAITTDTAGQFNEFTLRKNLSPGWSTTQLSVALNPYQTISPGGGGGTSNTYTQNLAQKCRSLFGQQINLGNNSYRFSYIAATTLSGQSVPGNTITVNGATAFNPGPGFIAVLKGSGTGLGFQVLPFTNIVGNVFHGVTGQSAGYSIGTGVVGVALPGGSGGSYQTMYAMMAGLGAPIGIQTSTLIKMGSSGNPTNIEFVEVLGAAAAMGATYCEIPNGFNTANPPFVTATQLGVLTSDFPLQPAGSGPGGATVASGAVTGESFQVTFAGTAQGIMTDETFTAETFTASVVTPDVVPFTSFPTVGTTTSAPAATTLL